MLHCSTTGLFLFFVAALCGQATAAASNNFDVLIFTQHWPKTVCYSWKESSAAHTCFLPKDDEEWTIHGIWPSQFNKLGPQFCKPSVPFNRTALRPVEGQLKEKWIDIEYGAESYSLWKHEWEKHGTCASVLEPLNTEVKYFKEGLTLLDRYDMKNVLAKASILPGGSYTATGILDGVHRVLGKEAQITCRKDKKSGKSYIFEIRICFDKTLQLIDCNGIYEFPTNCDLHQNVIYPGTVPGDHFVIQS